MGNWTKETALMYLNELIVSISDVKESGRGSAEHMRWLTNCLTFIEEVFGDKSMIYNSIYRLSWGETGNMIITGNPAHYEYEISQRHKTAFQKQLEQAKGFLLSAKDQLERSSIADVFVANILQTNELIKLLKIGEHKLRKTIRTLPILEKEIQDKYHDLLIGSELKYSREYPHIEYSSKQYIPDFSFTELDAVVEIKLCKPSDEKKLIAQLNDDILAYKTKFNTVLFVIYDIGGIRDVDEFKNAFEKHENVFVQIVKH